ncbi:MAG: polymerase subunit alpha, partial [Gaiellales bacterium]|nr:polymerase subunit alpha [Gaiellales bacterium]
TQGVYIYQEQAMQIAKDLAGFTPAEADDLRKAISKKVHALMASLREKFLAGCEANGVAHSTAVSLWEENERSADYSFNKAHAACYAMIAYRTAYLKANHPGPYMAALISSVMQTKDKVPFYVNACGEMGIEVLPPDVNSSGEDFTVVEGRIRFGLSAVKGVGEGAVRAMVLAREQGGPFTTLWDFCERVDATQINKRVLESLVKCGGLDSTGATRGAMLAALEAAATSGQKAQADALAGQASIFDLGSSGEDEPQRHHPPVLGPELEKKELLAFEKETLGLYLTDHPLAEVADQLRRRVDLPLRDLPNRREHETVSVGGLIASLRVTTSRSGDPMAFARLDDGVTQVEVVVFGKVYGACREHLVEDAIVIVKGRVDRRDEGETKLRAIEIAPFEAVPARGEVRLRVDGRVAGPAFVEELTRIISSFPGEASVVMEVATDEGARVLRLGPAYKVSPKADFFSEVRVLGGEAQLV